ncbi:hypothetical protein [Sphingobium yanoikuyae]|jgi:hypothetical protein|nr:hypothetical protein [Sphingobium yanoikuyae]
MPEVLGEMKVRPQSIINFERLMFGTFVLGLIQSYLGWDRATQMASAGFILTVQALTFGLMIALVLFLSRRRSKIAMWILIIMFLIGLPFFFKMISQGALLGAVWIGIAQTLGQFVAYGLLFTSSARDWLKGIEPGYGR